MRKLTIGVAAAAAMVILCVSCRTRSEVVKQLSRPDGKEMSIVGAERDSHGCLGSAGYVWSEVWRDCIRIFEAGVCLKDAVKRDAVLGTYVVFAADSSRVEVFLPMSDVPPVLERKADVWTDGALRLCRSAEGRWQLWKGDRLEAAE